jgi:hypothetical protein
LEIGGPQEPAGPSGKVKKRADDGLGWRVKRKKGEEEREGGPADATGLER